MTQNSMGAYKGTFGEKTLDPDLLEKNYTGEESSRIRVTRFKREALKAAAGSAAVQPPVSPAPDIQAADRDIRPAVKKDMDIYFTRDYVKVNELIENGEGKFFEIKSKYGHVTHSAIKREIHTTLNGEKYYDLVSPYGYGGPVIHESTNREKLISEFEDCFSVYCANNNIVSEFIRFHPIFQNQEDFRDIYDTTYLRQTVGTDFIKFEDTFQNEFSRTARTKIRKRLRDDRFSFHIDKGFENVESFINIYNLTMERHNASEFYYFNREYFHALKDRFGDDIMTISVKFEDRIIAMGLYLLSGDIIHDHLNGTDPDYLEHSPAYLLKYASMKWGVENGYSLIHYGGGVSNAEDDPVLHFKKRFSKHTEFKFHIGKKIWNQKVYDHLCEIRGLNKNREYFPAYR